MDVLRVQEIKGYTDVTKIPNTPSHIKRALNLRGTIDYAVFAVIVVVVGDKVTGWWRMPCRTC
ncbi:MAG: chemotaxis protein CheW [Nitrospira sp.]|nr:chemotaxis protein CheW [Nitrospira sp.]